MSDDRSHPAPDPSGALVDGTRITAGVIDGLFREHRCDNTIALRFIAATIGTHLRPAECPRPHTPGGRYCFASGTPLVDPAQP